ncbi:MAG: class I SAM-dependent methyltransferase [Terriglobales bacterium]
MTANPFEDPVIALGYEKWYAGPGKRADELEKDLLAKMLALFPQAKTVLEVGCGTGHFSRWLASRGFQTVGLDCSTPMLQQARRHPGVAYIRGDAYALPCANRAFDLVLMVTTLEFLQEPSMAIREAVRVARQGLLLGVLNRWSGLAIRRRIFSSAIWRAAHFYSVRQLAQLTRDAAAARAGAAHWRTTLWPIPWLKDLSLPWGGFIAWAVELNRMDDKPLASNKDGATVLPVGKSNAN